MLLSCNEESCDVEKRVSIRNYKKKSSAYKIEKNVTGFSVIKLTEYDDFFALRLFYSLSFFNVDFSGVLLRFS